MSTEHADKLVKETIAALAERENAAVVASLVADKLRECAQRAAKCGHFKSAFRHSSMNAMPAYSPMNELLLLLQALDNSDEQLGETQKSLDTFNTAAAQTVDLLTQLRDRANEAAEALSRVIAAQSQI